jgi:CMP-2-keto-3-deoxyoctulosonic acid synthetase
MPKKVVLTENQLKRVLSFVVNEQSDEPYVDPTPKDEVLTLLKAMTRDLQRANSGNFAHMSANLRGGVEYIMELVSDELINKPNGSI